MDNQRNPPVCSRMDQFLISHDCFLKFSGICQDVLQRMISDFFPICIMSDGVRWSSTPFRSDNKWLKVEGFRSFVERV